MSRAVGDAAVPGGIRGGLPWAAKILALLSAVVLLQLAAAATSGNSFHAPGTRGGAAIDAPGTAAMPGARVSGRREIDRLRQQLHDDADRGDAAETASSPTAAALRAGQRWAVEDGFSYLAVDRTAVADHSAALLQAARLSHAGAAAFDNWLLRAMAAHDQRHNQDRPATEGDAAAAQAAADGGGVAGGPAGELLLVPPPPRSTDPPAFASAARAARRPFVLNETYEREAERFPLNFGHPAAAAAALDAARWTRRAAASPGGGAALLAAALERWLPGWGRHEQGDEEPPLASLEEYAAAASRRAGCLQSTGQAGRPGGPTTVPVGRFGSGATVPPHCFDVCGELRGASLVHQADVTTEDREYLRRHVLFAVVTGAFDGHFRADLALCSWMRHVPSANAVFLSDDPHAALATERRRGLRSRFRWVAGELPSGFRFSAAERRKTGYGMNWTRAQFRFVQGLQFLAADVATRHVDPAVRAALSAAGATQRATAGEHEGVTKGVSGKATGGWQVFGGNSSDIRVSVAGAARPDPAGGLPVVDARWIAVIDDDTFVAIPALVKLLRRHDKDLATPVAQHVNGGDGEGGPGAARGGVSGGRRSLVDAVPTYLGDNGWGGAGHFFSLSAAHRFAERGEPVCVGRHMARRHEASDVALRKCLPKIGVRQHGPPELSHCTARRLRDRLVSGAHATVHLKRDVVLPPRLAVWRLGLYYRTMYHQDRSAFDALMAGGACSYGYSCKVGGCSYGEDAAALRYFGQLSGEGGFVPTL